MALQKWHDAKHVSAGLIENPQNGVHTKDAFSPGLCMAKIVHKYLSGSAKVPRCKTFFSRADREPPKPCALQRYGAFLSALNKFWTVTLLQTQKDISAVSLQCT